ncbi:sugar phosphate isomerase/epimerase family protein [Kibdelosporangium phytohabitans]|uniref:Sugar phosphate isomerase n=1 Tax=Kibdelosporangium phytohabitans TaxID=860235 RepID=A0A0N9I4N6_9PSEU|nr:sugar phosphate isomerase/epimerase [Kibdelosporangium phytohabitans]ALG11058.1 sugar phosphate isomerase [Kibdelosporangium phytohabitans]MBE1462292.1 sugar phosphate isomerase/epimerase [Kibdelosporangium phytohabitans]
MELSRRSMLRGAAAAGVAAVALPGTAAAASSRPKLRIPRDKISIQLYTLRSNLQNDLEGTLSALADIGYQRVELAGTYGRSAAEFRKLLDKYHIQAPSSHINIGDDINKLIADAKILGNQKLVHPYENHGTAAGWKAFATRLEAAGQTIREAGFTLGYHNHDHEFRKVEGQRPWDLITKGTTHRNVHLQIDLFWAVHAGADPIWLVYENYGRVLHYHVKDRTKDGKMVDPGKGVIDFGNIFRRTWHEGIDQFIVEHDEPTDALVTAKTGFDYLANLRF